MGDHAYPMTRELYAHIVSAAWDEFLQSDASSSEQNVQRFLEEHPCLVPGSHGTTQFHSPYPFGLISQPRLSGLGTQIPDFMWLAESSSEITPVLIEIETPRKRWFTNEGIQHSDLTQALNQLAEWRIWFNKPTNQQVFIDWYEIPRRKLHKNFIPRYILIYGLRSEFGEDSRLLSKISQVSREDEELIMFDRLMPDPTAMSFLCVRKTDDYFKALSVPPTFSPLATAGHVGKWIAAIRGKQEAVFQNRYLTDQGKVRLISVLKGGP